MGNPGEDHLSLPIMRPEPAGILGVDNSSQGSAVRF